MSRVRSGHLLIAIGVIHCAVGVLLGFPHLVEIAQAGVFNAVTDDQPWRMAIFWFQAFGVMAVLLGSAWAWAEGKGMVLPRSQAVGCATMAAAGVVCMPLSGFWLLFGVSALIWFRASSEKSEAHRMNAATPRL